MSRQGRVERRGGRDRDSGEILFPLSLMGVDRARGKKSSRCQLSFVPAKATEGWLALVHTRKKVNKTAFGLTLTTGPGPCWDPLSAPAQHHPAGTAATTPLRAQHTFPMNSFQRLCD